MFGKYSDPQEGQPGLKEKPDSFKVNTVGFFF
jgi:hypothetical protein